MNNARLCERCYNLDIEGFGAFKICPIKNIQIYTYFECTSLCDYCRCRPAIILKSNNPMKYSCKQCYG